MKPIINSSGTKIWYDSELRHHRIDGPAAILADGTPYWFRNGIPHRLDGPALIHTDGGRVWCFLGKFYSEQQHILLSNVRFFTKKVEI